MNITKFSIAGRHLDIRERIFRMIVLVGGFANVIAVLETLFINGFVLESLPLVILLFTIIFALFLSIKHHKNDAAAIIVGLVLCFLAFPTTYFSNGGIMGGSTVWFAINIIYAFLMFSGRKLAFFIVLDTIVDISVYYYSYLHPEAITQLASREDIYFDSAFSVIIVGLAIGAMIKFQIDAYEEEREIVREQTRALEKASAEKDSFFASMSHEIRTPINTIIGLNEMILRNTNDDRIEEYAQNVQSASNMLLGIVNDILDMSQMQMKRMEIVDNEYSTRALFGEIIDIVSVLIKEKKLDFYLDIDENIPKILFGDRKRIEQILINLLTNATKYTEKGSVSFTVKSLVTEKDVATLKMIIEDTGIGIKKEDIENLYDAFKRVDSKSNAHVQGSGLGLTITKQLVDMMDGSITVDSTYKKGSVFTVELRQKIVDPTGIGGQEQFYKKNSKTKYSKKFEAPEARILVVDDNEMNIRVVSELLSETKVSIETATSGEAALAMTKNHYYNVILLDHLMPGMDGIETIQRIRSQENGLCRDSAIIALTANAGSEAQKLYMDSGFDSYLEKPVNGRMLEEYILAYLPKDIVEYQYSENEHEDELIIRKKLSKRKKRLVITTDAIADIPDELRKEYDIDIMYLYIKTKHGRFADGIEIDANGLEKYMTPTGIDANVDIVTLEEYETFFAKQLDRAEEVIHITAAANTSKSYDVAVAAAKRFDHVHIIDSQQISCGQGMVVLNASMLARAGNSVEDIIEKIEDIIEHVESKFILPTAKMFYQKGYTRYSIARICELFRLKPVLKIRKSRIKVVGFRIGHNSLSRTRFIKSALRKKKRIRKDKIFISHVCLSVADQNGIITEINKYKAFEKVYIQSACCACACSTGKGSYGIAYYVEK